MSRVKNREVPFTSHGCTVEEAMLPSSYLIRSSGAFGGENVTGFRAQDDLALIFMVSKRGLLGTRKLNTPVERHVDVLRELGFKQMLLPNETRYEIRSGIPGIRRIGS